VDVILHVSKQVKLLGQQDKAMIKRLIKIILPISLILLASCHSKKEERQQYTLGAPEAKEGVDIRYFQKRLDGENGHDFVDFMAIIYNEHNFRREETLYYYSSQHKTILNQRKFRFQVKNGELIMFENEADTVGRCYFSVNTDARVIYSTEPKAPGYIPITHTHTLQGTRKVKLSKMSDTIDVYSFYTPYTYVHEEYYDKSLKLVKFSESYYDLDFSMEQIDSVYVPKEFVKILQDQLVLDTDPDMPDNCISSEYVNKMEKNILMTVALWREYINNIDLGHKDPCSERESRVLFNYLRNNSYRNLFLTKALEYSNKKNEHAETLFMLMLPEINKHYRSYANVVDDFPFLMDYPECRHKFKHNSSY